MQIVEQVKQASGKFFDSLAYAKRMESVGFTRQQAEALAEEHAKLIDDRLATKDDISLVQGNIENSETSLRQSLVDMEKSLRNEVAKINAETKAEILKWMFGTIGLQTLVLLGAMLAIIHSNGH